MDSGADQQRTPPAGTNADIPPASPEMEMNDGALLSSLGAVAVDCDALTQQVLAQVELSFNDNLTDDIPEGIGYKSSVETLGTSKQQYTSVAPTTSQVEARHNEEKIFGSSSMSILHSLLSGNRALDDASEFIAVEPVTQKRSEAEERVRLGEMTPFGTSFEADSSQPQERPCGPTLSVSAYLENQSRLQDEFKKQQRKKAQQRKRRRMISEDLTTTDDDDHRPAQNSSKRPTKEKNVLNPSILFPKPRPKKTKLGTTTTASKNKVHFGNLPGLVPGEETSMYVNETEDSDYIPDTHSDSQMLDVDDTAKSKADKKSPRRIKKTRKVSSSWESSETDPDEKPKRGRKVTEYTDDGNTVAHQNRVQRWKETETRFTSEVHKMEGGFKLPKYIWDSLFKYQKVGVKWLWELHQQRAGGILSDEMGLGKTIQVICFLAGLSCSDMLFRFSEFRGVGPSLIICPATVMNQWVKEFHKWWPPFRIGLLHESGTYTGRKESFIQSMHASRGFIVISYSGAVQNQDELMKYAWDYLILDEGHKIRNPDAQVTIALKRIPTPRRLILSGSPLQNNLKELWSLFDFVTPGRLGTLPTFLEKFAVPITQGGYSNASDLQVATAYKCATTLRDIINPYILRRMKSDVKDHLELPGKNEQVLFCKVTDEQRTAYKAYLKSDQIRNVINGGEHRLFVALINLRKICNHPHLFDGGSKQGSSNRKVYQKSILEKRLPKNRVGFIPDTGTQETIKDDGEDQDIEVEEKSGFGHWKFSGKMIVVRTLLSVWQKQGQKVLLFTQSRQMLCILEKFLQQETYTYLRLDGGTPIGTRATVIDKFNMDPSIFVFLLTTRVGGLGVNLTGANRVVIFDPDWNPSTDLQARERAWRIGQCRDVTIYRLITSGTIEEKIYHRQIFKQFLTNRILKDPRQKRFFKQNQLLELFSFNDDCPKGETETEIIFEGTDSTVRRPRKAKRSSATVTSAEKMEARENSKGKFRGVPNLAKQRPFSEGGSQEAEGAKQSEHVLSQDEYVLRKLFKKSVVNVALKHDQIVDAKQPDIAIIEKEAEMVAKDAIRMLKKSRQQCWDATSGRVTWTGTHGTLRKINKHSASLPVKSKPDAEVKAGDDENSLLFSIPSNASTSSRVPTNAAELFAMIRARKRRSLIDSKPQANAAREAASSSNVEAGDVDSSAMELLADIRSFVAFRGTADGEVTTVELVAEFGSKLPSSDSVLFKQMLSQLCTSRQVQARKVWRLKPEFR